MLYRLSIEMHPISAALAKAICLLAVALMLLFPFLEGVKYALPLGLATTYAIAFSLFAFSLMNWPSSPLINYPITWIGKVSYSAYFMHFLALHFVPPIHLTGWPPADFAFAYIAIVTITICIASLTYLLIEKPLIRIGNRIVLRKTVHQAA